jgi:hypothetical protein
MIRKSEIHFCDKIMLKLLIWRIGRSPGLACHAERLKEPHMLAMASLSKAWQNRIGHRP